MKKFSQFNIYTNPDMTEAEKARVLDAYMDTDTYRKITFHQELLDLVNRIHRDYPKYRVFVNSNCSTEPILREKWEQLTKRLILPSEQIQMNLINIRTGSFHKQLPEQFFLFVDDSPHNIILSEVDHRIMPAKPYNKGILDEQGRLSGHPVDRPDSVEELIRMVETYLEINS